MKTIQTYLNARYSRVADFFSRETDALALSCKKEDRVLDILHLLAEPTQSSLAVLEENGKLIGIVSERDVIRYCADHERLPSDLSIEALMTKSPMTIKADQTCIEALKLMVDGRFRNLPVLENGDFAGLLSVLQAVNGRLLASAEANKELLKALALIKSDFINVDINRPLDELVSLMKQTSQSLCMVSEGGGDCELCNEGGSC